MSSAISALSASTPPPHLSRSRPEQLPRATTLRAQQDAAIVEASLATLGSGQEPQALVLRAAIDRINELLAPELGEDAIQQARPEEFTPEATAARIVSLSTGFFEAWQRQHPELEGDAALERFMDTIRGGFEKGFRDAERILQGLGVLGGSVASGIAQTYALVQEGYSAFTESRRSAASADAAPGT
ncbi:MAG TPA: DUF5610 domain-containing protein [Solimonas sp.]|nr:DUF5610 domain-containing protein [Solimonas sp.]